MRIAARKIRGAVDRIYDPRTGPHFAPTFFPQHAVSRKSRGDALCYQALDFAVGFGQIVLVAFQFEIPGIAAVE